jgi:predicted SAM-dependent methyltransferase
MRENKVVLDVGCGPYKRPGAVGLDILPLPGVDVVHNLGKYPYPFQANSFDEIYCYHVLEHVDDMIATVKELYRIMKPGGVLFVRVPHASCCTTAWGDPTHKRFFVHRSFEHFDSRSDHYHFGTDFRIRSRRLHYFLYEGVRNGVVLQRLPLWLNSVINKLANINLTTQAIFERLLCYYVGGFEEVYFEMVAHK